MYGSASGALTSEASVQSLVSLFPAVWPQACHLTPLRLASLVTPPCEQYLPAARANVPRSVRSFVHSFLPSVRVLG